MKRFALSAVRCAVAASALLFSTACVGVYNNTNQFLNDPKEGMAEGDLIRTYGTPAFTGFAENEKIYTYKVRDTKYIVLVGLYEGYDLVVTCKNGIVTDSQRVKRPEAFTLFQPLPWAVAE